ncbi:long-chain fatty acid--CoA ligase [Bordetella genomosp. 13]|uniref:Long-chain fatty acid--CoA ligase n=2 Tax=Bordetella genomosp. 13 TaxID=463040 RepID=A0A1W6Z6P7_9BORD|nr:long-chain fatty acid--CoA ligase [Bordetella genomosp. 13]
MLGLMQAWPLLCQRVIEYAAREHGQRRVATRLADGSVQASDYRQVHETALRISKRLLADGIRAGDRIGTVAWSTARHMECWYGIAGIGAVYHPVNPRLFSEQIVHIVNDAADQLMFVDPGFVALLEPLAAQLPTVRRYIVLADEADMPATSLPNAISFEAWLGDTDADFHWPDFDENTAAALTYTSGTTGNPKGVLYSHRSIILMSLTGCAPDMYGFSARDNVMVLVPMYHANGWTWPFSAPMTGAGLVFPGQHMDGASVADLLVDEQVTVTGGVPTIWQTVLDHLRGQGRRLTALRRVYVGGSPCPRPVLDALQEIHGAEVRASYGMTEMGPLGSICTMRVENDGLQGDERAHLQQSQGRPPFLVETRIVDEGNELRPRDGKTIGHLQVRGPCIVRAYFNQPADSVTDDGYLDTGDIASIDSLGYIRLADRAKDLVKSGGEWISSIDMEHAATMHPAVQEAAVIGARHPKWDERPLLFVVPKADMRIDKAQLYDFLAGRMAKWWLPDDILFVDSIPHTATGKLNKAALRKQYGDYLVDHPEGRQAS